MALHFSLEEFAQRRAAACRAMAEAGLDGLLIFRQESLYYLTGYDSFGFVYFQCLVLSADGAMTLLTRSADRLQAERTSVIEDIRIWRDRDGAAPAEDLKPILEERGLKGAKLGVEYLAYGLTAFEGKRLDASLEGYARLEDASFLVTRLRLVKSEAEIAYVREAGRLADRAWQAAVDRFGPGAWEGDILTDMHGAIFRGDGDDPANPFIIGSGPDALLCRYKTGRRHLDAQDQLTLEWAGTHRHYHCAMMRTLVAGTPPPRQRDLYNAAAEALAAVEETLVPGKSFGEAFDAHARVIDAAGLSETRLNACGYSLGTTFAPNWMDWPMLYTGNPVIFAPGMVVFCHMILFDADAGLAMSLGRTSLVGPGGAESLSAAPLELTIVE